MGDKWKDGDYSLASSFTMWPRAQFYFCKVLELTSNSDYSLYSTVIWVFLSELSVQFSRSVVSSQSFTQNLMRQVHFGAGIQAQGIGFRVHVFLYNTILTSNTSFNNNNNSSQHLLSLSCTDHCILCVTDLTLHLESVRFCCSCCHMYLF